MNASCDQVGCNSVRRSGGDQIIRLGNALKLYAFPYIFHGLNCMQIFGQGITTGPWQGITPVLSRAPSCENSRSSQG